MFKLLKFAPFLLSILFSSIYPQNYSRRIDLEYKLKKLPFGLTEKVSSTEPSVALVLSGGGSRGLAQIGVLKAFQEKNIPITSIIGTSMGSILGGLYSAGYSIQDLDSIAHIIPWNQFLTSTDEANRNDMFVDQKITEDKALITFRLEGLHVVLPTSINNGQRFSSLLNLLTLNAPIHVKSNFDELRYDYKAVCTDLITGNAISLCKGSLSQAMRASASVSLFISPVKQDSLLLVDGGLVANIPVQLAKESGNDFIIAFNTTSPLNTEAELAYPWNIADQIISIPMRLLSEQQLKLADIVITPELGNKKNTDFSNIDSLVDIGYRSTIPFLDGIEEKIKLAAKSKLKKKEFFLKNIEFSQDAEPFESYYIHKYSHKDSLSSYEILDDLNELYSSGDYDSLYAKITGDSVKTFIKFVGKLNPTIKHVEISGISVFSPIKIDSIFSDLKDKPYNTRRVYSKLLQILKLYRNLGYSLAELEEASFDKTTGVLNVKFTEGIIAKIIVEGNQKTREDIIRREFPIEEGDFFEYKKVEKGLANLRGTNLFSDISLMASTSGLQNIIHLKVTEKPSSLMRFGLRIDNENRTQLSVDIRDENIAGSATELGLILSIGIRNRSYILEHKANRIFQTYLTYKVRGFYEFNDIYSYKDVPTSRNDEFNRISDAEYRQINQGFSLGLGMQVARFGNLIGEAKYERSEIRNINNFKDTYSINIATLGLLSTIDSQDKYPFPNKGFLIKTSYETAQKFFADVSYTKFYIDYISHISTSNEVHCFTPRVAVGFADQTLPLSQQFSLGGQNSFFGLRDNEFRGRQILLSSLEYRLKLPVRLFFDSYFKLRYDIGSTWENRDLIRFADLRHGAGATLSLDTPLGPADFSVGRSFLLGKNTPGSSVKYGPVFFYFTIGFYY
jgi:NTE family protein